MRYQLSLILALGVSLMTTSVESAWSEDTPLNYTTTSAIEADELPAARSRALTDFVLLPPKGQKRTAFPHDLCKSYTKEPASSAAQPAVAVALVEAELIPEVVFERSPSSEQGEAQSIRYSFEFSPESVLIRSSRPRYQSQAAGLNILFNNDSSQTVLYEGKNKLSVLFVVPPVRDCDLQLVVACPRTYTGYRTLEDSNVVVSGVQYFVQSKAQGLFKAPSGQEGKVQASTLATTRVSLPSSWFTYSSSSETPSASLQTDTRAESSDAPRRIFPLSPPFRDAVETRLEFGTSSEVKRVSRARATVEVSPITITTPQEIELDKSITVLQPGKCFVISRRKESLN